MIGEQTPEARVAHGAHASCRGRRGKGGGPSSFWMHDPALVYDCMDLKSGQVFLDAGFGGGDYSMHASGLLGEKGLVYALEKREDLVESLRQRADQAGRGNMDIRSCDILDALPLADESVDCALLSTVLHIFGVGAQSWGLFTEIRRVLRPDGRFCILECKKEKMDFGPPLHMRVSQEEVIRAVHPCGFRLTREVDLEFNYMLCFRPA